MKKITREEADNLILKPHGRATYFRSVVLSMKPGEIIFVEPKDWTQKSREPGTYLNIICKKTDMKFKCSKTLSKPGWVIERTK